MENAGFSQCFHLFFEGIVRFSRVFRRRRRRHTPATKKLHEQQSGSSRVIALEPKKNWWNWAPKAATSTATLTATPTAASVQEERAKTS